MIFLSKIRIFLSSWQPREFPQLSETKGMKTSQPPKTYFLRCYKTNVLYKAE